MNIDRSRAPFSAAPCALRFSRPLLGFCKGLPSHPVALTLLLTLAFTISGVAQQTPKPKEPYALIFGTVWDAQARPIYGAKIKIRRDDQKNAKWELISDHRGEFAQRVPAGKADYVVTAEIKSGKKGSHPVESKVHIENDERADIALHLTE